MEYRTDVPSSGESAKNGAGVPFNPADDSSSSYEASSSDEIERQEAASLSEYVSTIRRRQEDPRGVNKSALGTPTAKARGSLQLSSKQESTAKILYSDDWIKADAARWAANFTGPVDLENASEEELLVKARSGALRNRSRKRKAQIRETEKYKAKRPKGRYDDGYRQLLNQEIRDTRLPASYCGLPQSQVGVTIWTSVEKEAFFTALPKLGKDNVRAIALRIGSKSEFEVQEYIKLLNQGMVEKSSNEPRRQLLGFADMPAAVEISPECSIELERAADVLASRQDRYEEQKEEYKWGDFWLLDSGVSRWVEENLANDVGNHDLREVLPIAELLNLHNWLELSARIFMNPAAPREENWHYLAGPSEEPSIRATTFADFYRLAVSVTKRLVSTTIFFTMSRLRAMDPKSFNRYDLVKPADVEAAAKMIGLENNSDKFWRHCPRRCNLNITQTTSTGAGNKAMLNYDEVEELLNRRRKSDQSTAPLHRRPSSPAASIVASSVGSSDQGPPSVSELHSETEDVKMDSQARDLAMEYFQTLQREYTGPVDPSGSEIENLRERKRRLKKRIVAREALDVAQAEYTEAIDIQRSLEEEQRLWKLLKREPPFTIKIDNFDIPKRPTQERMEEGETKDWRDLMQFWSQWETLNRPVPAHAFFFSPKPATKPRQSRRTSEVGRAWSKLSPVEILDNLTQDNDISNDGNSEESGPDLEESESGVS